MSNFFDVGRGGDDDGGCDSRKKRDDRSQVYDDRSSGKVRLLELVR